MKWNPRRWMHTESSADKVERLTREARELTPRDIDRLFHAIWGDDAHVHANPRQKAKEKRKAAISNVIQHFQDELRKEHKDESGNI